MLAVATKPKAGTMLPEYHHPCAVKHGDHYVLNGSRRFITNRINSDLVIVVAQTDRLPEVQFVEVVGAWRGWIHCASWTRSGWTPGRCRRAVTLHRRGSSRTCSARGWGSICDAEPAARTDLVAIMAAAGMESVLEQTLQLRQGHRAFGRSIASGADSCWPSWLPGHCGAHHGRQIH